jgi:hypothetical protein
MPSSSATAPTSFVYADKPSTSGKITSTTTTIEPQRPYQIQTLADLRSGSLPPTDEISDGSGRKQKQKEETGARTEPEDTDDYSSSGIPFVYPSLK